MFRDLQSGFPWVVQDFIARQRGARWSVPYRQELARVKNKVVPMYEYYVMLRKQGEPTHSFRNKKSVQTRAKIESGVGVSKKDVFHLFNALHQLTDSGDLPPSYLEPVGAKKLSDEKIKGVQEVASKIISPVATPAGEFINKTANKILVGAGVGLAGLYLLNRSLKNGAQGFAGKIRKNGI